MKYVFAAAILAALIVAGRLITRRIDQYLERLRDEKRRYYHGPK